MKTSTIIPILALLLGIFSPSIMAKDKPDADQAIFTSPIPPISAFRCTALNVSDGSLSVSVKMIAKAPLQGILTPIVVEEVTESIGSGDLVTLLPVRFLAGQSDTYCAIQWFGQNGDVKGIIANGDGHLSEAT